MTRDESRGRCFVALALNEATSDAMARRGAAIRRSLDADRTLRWIRPELFHLTLRFLGPSTDAQIEAISAALSELARATTALELEIGGLGAFPSMMKPRVLWLGVHAKHDHLTSLQRECERAAQQAGLTADETPYRPHLTLARVQRRARAKDVDALGSALAQHAHEDPIPWRATQLVLLESRIGREPRYVEHANYALA